MILRSFFAVKQVIGWANILPFSELWRRTDLSRKINDLSRLRTSNIYNNAAISRLGTPEGGIILHYIASIVQIGISTTIHDLKLAIALQSSAVIYGHLFFEGQSTDHSARIEVSADVSSNIGYRLRLSFTKR